ncbi:MAG: PD-(D/E)XK nuclease family protein [Candidatus Nanoarchaeia archaeon]
MIELSPSKLNLMEDCPRCFWLLVNKNVKRPGGPMAGVLTKMDSVIKHYFEKYRDSGTLPPIIRGKVDAKLARGIPKTLYYEGEDVKVEGKPDEYLDFDGFIVPFDHKVSKGKSAEDTHKAYVLQLDFYTFLLKVNNFKTKNEAYLAYYYPCDCDVHDGVDITCDVVKIKTDPDRARRVLEKAVRLLNGRMPAPSPECDFCKYKGLKF